LIFFVKIQDGQMPSSPFPFPSILIFSQKFRREQMPDSPIYFSPSVLIFSQNFRRGPMPDSPTDAHGNSPCCVLELSALMTDKCVVQIWWISHCYLHIAMTHLHRLWERDVSVSSVEWTGRKM
jgi:hypothetical protein